MLGDHLGAMPETERQLVAALFGAKDFMDTPADPAAEAPQPMRDNRRYRYDQTLPDAPGRSTNAH
jgi:hypothetical protein